MNAREPNQADLKELQLADIAQEMAIAAGLPAPKIMLVDSIGANAAAVGTSPHDARIVISRRLLDDLDRDQMQAILAHLVGSIGNGDLGIAFTVTSVFETCGLLLSLINIPFGRNRAAASGAWCDTCSPAELRSRKPLMQQPSRNHWPAHSMATRLEWTTISSRAIPG